MEQLKFYNEEHREFYNSIVKEYNLDNDCYRKSLIYALGLTEETRKHCKEIYDFEKQNPKINIKYFNEPWQTDTSLIATRIALNLYNGFTGVNTVDQMKTIADEEEQEEITEKSIERLQTRLFSVENLFWSRDIAPYLYEAIRIRFEMV